MEDIKNLDGEVWKDVVGYEGLYQVSNKGRVKVLERKVCVNEGYRIHPQKILIPNITRNNYHQVWLRMNGVRSMKKIHRLVVEAFIGKISHKHEVDHKDNNPANNSLDNLQIVTSSQNKKFRYDRGYRQSTEKKVMQLSILGNNVINIFDSIREAERKTGIASSSIAKCCRHRSGHKSAGGCRWEYIDSIK